MATLSNLPPELILTICELLIPPDERIYSGRTDLITVCQLDRNLNATVRRLLFRDITLTFTLKDELPAEWAEWQEQRWETPEIIGLLQGSEELRDHVRNVRLRIYPFPIGEWTVESFDDIRQRLVTNSDSREDIHFRHMTDHARDLRKRDPRSAAGYQRFVIHAYAALCLCRCGWPEMMTWTENLAPVLQQLFDQLPRLQHLETADMTNDPYLPPFERESFVPTPADMRSHIMYQWSTSYADKLILRTAPTKVRSVCFKS